MGRLISITVLSFLFLSIFNLKAQDDIEWQQVFFNGGNICPELGEWQPVFHDDFCSDQLDTSNWQTYFGSLDTKFSRLNDPEINQQIYLDENITINDGILSIHLINENASWMGVAQPYSSGWLNSLNRYTTFSRFESRIKIPCEQGLIPAFWVFGWTSEIDIFEHLDGNPGDLKGSVHEFPVSKPGERETNTYDFPDIGNICNEFHTYAVEYSSFRIDFFIDNELVLTFPRYHTYDGISFMPFNNCEIPFGIYWEHPNFPRFGDPLQIIANIAVGNGGFGGEPDASSTFPTSMEIDYISVWQLDPQSGMENICEVKTELSKDTFCIGEEGVLNFGYPSSIYSTSSSCVSSSSNLEIVDVDINSGTINFIGLSKGGAKISLEITAIDCSSCEDQIIEVDFFYGTPNVEIVTPSQFYCNGDQFFTNAKLNDEFVNVDWSSSASVQQIDISNNFKAIKNGYGIIQAQYENECGTSSTTIEVTVNECDDISKRPVKMYPNPTSTNILYLEREKGVDLSRVVEIDIRNQKGQSMFSRSFNNGPLIKIQMPPLQNGIYFLTLVQDNGANLYSEKLIVNLD